MRKRGVLLGGLSVVFASLLATAPADARNLYFDMWCQEQGYDKARCDQRQPADVAAFEEYWRAVEKYEEQYFTERQSYGNFRDELNSLDEIAAPGFNKFDPEKSDRPN
ncbi:MAG: hypothetical protein K8S25_05080 [Alphaproteobacteria bacterium]|nr:hypothetical protein [Alphaproteobacteria bacterium]